MELNEIKEIIDMLRDSDISELSIEKEGVKFTIKKERYSHAVSAQPVLQPAPSVVKEAEIPAPAAEADQGFIKVTSPIVGIFYTASSPEAPPFVQAGSRVEKGQVLCIVEAMKLMNEIESDCNGIVKKILPGNGQPVEYGETLFIIEPLS
ncbi:MAG: acetyl-CoA carboxylase biotin carboxyl carrier protein [Nitrospirae bacterium]|nr:acetyl-CoA carboxylase biotin carboxyl carrier protein [Nitrospirota bacterium]